MTSTGTEHATRLLTIQEVSQRTGLSEPTLRYYEQIGLIPQVERDPSSGHRRYDPVVLETLESLACLRSAGMRIEDMRRYLDLLERGEEAAGQQRDLFHRHAERLSGEIERLRIRLHYLQLKAEMWDARERGDVEAEQRAIEQILLTTRRF